MSKRDASWTNPTPACTGPLQKPASRCPTRRTLTATGWLPGTGRAWWPFSEKRSLELDQDLIEQGTCRQEGKFVLSAAPWLCGQGAAILISDSRARLPNLQGPPTAWDAVSGPVPAVVASGKEHRPARPGIPWRRLTPAQPSSSGRPSSTACMLVLYSRNASRPRSVRWIMEWGFLPRNSFSMAM